MKTVLTIAGSDCSGGAGIQADLKTIGAFGLYGMSVLTAVTVQNTLGVKRVEPLAGMLVREQMEAVFEDIVPDAVKIGMIVTEENIRAVASVLNDYRKQTTHNHPFVVLDTVLISTSGRELLKPSAMTALMEELFPLADMITPNIPEAVRLWGNDILGREEREEAAAALSSAYGCSVLIKGGHGGSSADDLLYQYGSEKVTWYESEKVENDNTHGTGCTLSSAIACGMAGGKTMEDAVREAKTYITGAIRDGMNLGKGNGPLNHFYKSNL